MKKKETCNIRDLYPVGPATVRDLKKSGSPRWDPVGQDARKLYDRLCRLQKSAAIPA
jgi:hypothetical protein